LMRCQFGREAVSTPPSATAAAPQPAAATGPTAGYQTRPVVGPSERNGACFDAKRWRVRAEQSSALADEASDPTARATLLEIARAYEHLAQGAETRDEKSAFAAPRAFFHIG
jgi:hypothetical protein